jgi:hypothetical protein
MDTHLYIELPGKHFNLSIFPFLELDVGNSVICVTLSRQEEYSQFATLWMDDWTDGWD